VVEKGGLTGPNLEVNSLEKNRRRKTDILEGVRERKEETSRGGERPGCSDLEALVGARGGENAENKVRGGLLVCRGRKVSRVKIGEKARLGNRKDLFRGERKRDDPWKCPLTRKTSRRERGFSAKD